MSNNGKKSDKNEKHETKTETKQEGATTAIVTTQPAKVEAARARPDAGALIEKTLTMSLKEAVVFASKHKVTLGHVLARRDPNELDNECGLALESLRDLITDATIPSDAQKALSVLVDQAAAVRPGMEEVNTRWRIARVQIAQATSTTAAKPENAKNGDLFTTAGKLLEKPFGFIPFYFNFENIMFPMGAKAPACQAPDAKLGQPYGECVKCPHLPFGLQNGGKGDQKKTDCQNQIVAVVLASDLSNVYMIQFAKTSRGAGSALMALAGQMQFSWKQSYLLSTEKGNSELGNFHKMKVEPTGRDNPEHVQKVCAALNELYSMERYRALSEWYRGASTAPAVAAAAESEFKGGGLDAGLAGESEPIGLGDDAPAPTGSVRTAAKPM